MTKPKSKMSCVGILVIVAAMAVCFPMEALARGWTIQVRSCLSEPEADGVVKNLRAYGLEPMVSYERAGNKGMRYRILVGQFDTGNAAEIYGRELKSSGIIKSYWVKPANTGSSDRMPAGPVRVMEGDLNYVYPTNAAEVAGSVVYPPMPGEAPMVEAPVMAGPPQMAGYAQAMPGPCTGTVHSAPNQMMMVDQPPMHGCAYPEAFCPDCEAPHRRGFFLGYRFGFMVWPSADQFDIVQTAGGVITTWQADYSVVPRVSFITGYRFNKHLAMEGSLDLPQTSNWTTWFLGFTPKFILPLPGYGVSPYIKGGPVFGSFAWTNAPGSFDDTWGWEIGAGMDIELDDHFTLEAGAGYRDIAFEYEGTGNARAGHGDLDLSGYSLDVSFRYRF